MMKIQSGLIILFTFLLSCSGPQTATEANQSYDMVTFRGRTIDLKPYVDGFPFQGIMPVYEAGKIFYRQVGETTVLKEISLEANADLYAGKAISDIDFSLRNVFGYKYNPADMHLYWYGDEKNDEVLNLYRLNPATREVEKLTDVPYIFTWNFNEAKDKIAYVARLGVLENRLGELRILDLKSGEEEVIIQDTPEFRFSWGQVSWRPDESGLVITALRDAKRSAGNLMYVDLETKTAKLITDPETGRFSVYAMEEWLDNESFLYQSNEDGYNNVYRYSIASGKSSQLTTFEQDVETGELIHGLEEDPYLFLTTSSPLETRMMLMNPASGEILHSSVLSENLDVRDTENNKMMVSLTSAASLFSLKELTVSADGFSFEDFLDMPEALSSKIIQADVERISYPTFDIDPNTGEQRMIHAYLYKPKNPLPKEQQVVMIQSFYGGTNYFSNRTQILAEAGVYVLSPSPRGSRGFGKEFYALNDKDLGGNEIIDIIYAGKYISEKLDIPPSRIGVYGGSHGGYATMRLLTFPGEINGNKASFDWGFGISHAGFSDIIHFYENCNIPDWVILEAGDPKTEADKLNDRSPLYHADKMVGKLLLTHGTNDSRVPIAGSRMMADSLAKYNKPFKLVEFEGQGHGIKGLENEIRNYQTWFEFIEGLEAM